MAVQKQASEKENVRAAPVAADRTTSKEMGFIEAAFLGAVSIAVAMWNAVTADGTLAAAARQGADELGAALKAFPESIQVQETGTLWNPTQSEIATERQHSRRPGSYASYSSTSGPQHTWPSEFASRNQHQAGNDHGNGHDNGHDAGHSM